MARLARYVAILAALYMAFALVWDGARDPYMGMDIDLYGASARPAKLIGQPWPAQQMKQWSAQYDVDVMAIASVKHPGLVAGYPAPTNSQFNEWVQRGYPCLRQPCVTKAVSLADNPGAIQSFEMGVSDLTFMGANASSAAQAAESYFATLGWQTGTQELNSRSVWVTRLHQLFPQALIVVTALIFLLMAGHVLTHGRTVGVQLLQGIPRWQIWLAETMTWSWRLLLETLAAGSIGLIVSQLLWHRHFLNYMALAGLIFLTVFWVAGVAGSVVAHQILRATSILEAVKGRLRFGLSFPVVYALRTYVVILSGTLLLSLGQAWVSWQSNLSLQENLGSAAAFSSFAANQGSLDNRDVRAAATREAAQLFASGELTLTQATPAYYFAPGIEPDVTSGQDRMVMQVNPVYLKTFPVRLTTGRQLNPAQDIDKFKVTILVPDGTSSETVSNVASTVAISFSTGTDGKVPGWDLKRVPTREVSIAPGARMFTNAEDGFRVVSDPIIVVLPQAFEPGPSMVFGGNLLVRTSDVPSIVRSAPMLSAGSTGFDSVPSQINQLNGILEADFAHKIFELAAFLLLLPLASAAIALMYAQQHARRLFVQTISGRPLYEMIPLILALDLASLCGVAWFARPGPATVTQLHAFGENALTAPLYTFLAVLGVFALVLLLQYLLFLGLRRRVLLQRGGET